VSYGFLIAVQGVLGVLRFLSNCCAGTLVSYDFHQKAAQRCLTVFLKNAVVYVVFGVIRCFSNC